VNGLDPGIINIVEINETDGKVIIVDVLNDDVTHNDVCIGIRNENAAIGSRICSHG